MDAVGCTTAVVVTRWWDREESLSGVSEGRPAATGVIDDLLWARIEPLLPSSAGLPSPAWCARGFADGRPWVAS
jgi:hypothetical protein